MTDQDLAALLAESDAVSAVAKRLLRPSPNPFLAAAELVRNGRGQTTPDGDR